MEKSEFVVDIFDEERVDLEVSAVVVDVLDLSGGRGTALKKRGTIYLISYF